MFYRYRINTDLPEMKDRNAASVRGLKFTRDWFYSNIELPLGPQSEILVIEVAETREALEAGNGQVLGKVLPKETVDPEVKIPEVKTPAKKAKKVEIEQDEITPPADPAPAPAEAPVVTDEAPVDAPAEEPQA